MKKESYFFLPTHKFRLQQISPVIRVYAYHQSGQGGASITQMAKQDGGALFAESGTIDTNRLLALQ